MVRRRITPRPFAAMLIGAGTVLDMGATAMVRRRSPRFVRSISEEVVRDWQIAGADIEATRLRARQQSKT